MKKTTEMAVVARNTKLGLCWLRTPILDGLGYKILTLSDDVLPHGMKTATRVLVEWDGNVTTRKTGYWADVKVLENVSEGTGTTPSN